MKSILIVDDSLVYRNAVKKALKEHENEYEFVLAANGKQALDYVIEAEKTVSLIIIDIEMPEMDGVKATEEIRKISRDIPIIVFAAPTQVGAAKALEAIRLGANEFVKKFDLAQQNGDQIKDDLLPKVLSYLAKSSTSKASLSPKPKVSISAKIALEEKIKRCKMICIGASTGGPDVLRKIFSELKEPLKVPVMLVQHMPPVFTEQLANMCTKLSGQPVYEAKNTQMIESGSYYIAPGDFHMELFKEGTENRVKLQQNEKVCSVRPAYDVLVKSMQSFSGNILYIVLTGMGEDGANGIEFAKKNGDVVIIQDKESSVVWGMPGSIHAKNLQDYMCPASEIPHYIKLLKK